MKNNKERVPLDYYKSKYRQLDPVEASGRCGFKFDPQRGAFSVQMLGFELSAAWPEFSLVPESDGCPAILYGAEAKILVIRYLTEGRFAPEDGRFLTYREMPWGEVYDRNFQGRCIRRLAFSFGVRLNAFLDAARKLGGTELSLGDASCELPFFPWLKLRLILWAGDEEFPASSQFLFSGNTPLAFTAEDLAVVGDVVVGALKELASR